MSLKKWLNDRNLEVSAVGASALVLLLFGGSEWFAREYRTVSPFFRAEWAMRDLVATFGRPAVKDPRIVFLADDAPSHTLDQLWEDEIAASPTLKLMKKRVWSRQIWADVLDRLAGAGARVVAFDYMFKGEDDGDAALKAAIERHKNIVVLGSHIDDAAVLGQQMPSIAPPEKTILGEAADPRVGYVNMFPDPDGVVRKMRFRVTREELAQKPAPPGAVEYESMAARMARQAGEADKIPPGRGDHPIRYAYKGETLLEETKPMSLYSIFVPAMWEANFQNGEFFKGKIVLIGPEGNYTKDVGESPFGTIAGPEFHLNALNALLTGEFLRSTSPAIDIALVCAGAFLAWGVIRLIRHPIVRVLTVPPVAFADFTLGVVAFNAVHVAPVLSPVLGFAGTIIIATVWQQLIERLEKAKMRKTFERYVSRDVVKELLDNPQSYLNTIGGARKRVSVLFSDVRGFTTMTESADARALVKQLNEYFDHMVNLVFDNRGTLDKFIGDAVMAQWGGIYTEGEKEDAISAVRTAVQMRKRLAELNAQWVPRGMIALKFGIGVNHGEAIVGNLGCEAKMEVSMIGDAVNTASRLEGITKEYHLDLIIGESVEPFVRDAFFLRTVGLNQPKGKTVPLELFTVLDERQPGVQPPAWLATYEEGVQLFRKRDFATAAERFEAVLRDLPGDWLCEDYLADCRTYIAEPPPQGWTAVHVMKSK
ncbi:MAG: adenylate/guanylate cyclase domain-containing protein [Chthoniobacteraceae bacterium]